MEAESRPEKSKYSVAHRDRAPGTEGIWTFIFIDMMVFLLLFFVFMSERLSNYKLYKTSQMHLNAFFGFSNTLILLTSSWMVVEAIRSAKLRNPAQVSLRLSVAVTLGFVFCANKIFEYHLKFASGITVITNSFFTFYFFITFVHFLHVLAGLIFLLSFARSSSRCVNQDQYIVGLENVGLFWHFVDVLWIFIFPMLYLT